MQNLKLFKGLFGFPSFSLSENTKQIKTTCIISILFKCLFGVPSFFLAQTQSKMPGGGGKFPPVCWRGGPFQKQTKKRVPFCWRGLGKCRWHISAWFSHHPYQQKKDLRRYFNPGVAIPGHPIVSMHLLFFLLFSFFAFFFAHSFHLASVGNQAFAHRPRVATCCGLLGILWA